AVALPGWRARAAGCFKADRRCRHHEQCCSGKCRKGVCAECPAGKTACGGACVDTDTSLADCGGCGKRCDAACVGGACVACDDDGDCPAPEGGSASCRADGSCQQSCDAAGERVCGERPGACQACCDTDQCAAGQECANGRCACTSQSCDGCCDGDTCKPDRKPCQGACIARDACCGDGVLDTVVVPSTGGTVASIITLEQGVAYRLRASGDFANGTGGRRCDAEYCFSSSNPQTGSEDLCGSPTSVDIGLAVDDRSVDLDKNPRWGAYKANHVYEVQFTGKGAPAEFTFYDCNYRDNVGTLQVEIFCA
ncbi:MAG: hypothetical protein H0U10_02750, partial [Chloroflexia bacterium]|nr:hypothetical protein [Chloroflexia bacterium]